MNRKLLPLLLLFAACTTEDYETGDGDLSFMRADFAEVYTNSKSQMVSAMTDEGDSLVFDKPLEVKWVSTPDSCYRVLLYYNRKDEKVEPLSVQQVATPGLKKHNNKVPMDPLSVESSWKSTNGRYFNLGLVLKTAGEIGDKKHMIGISVDSVKIHDDGSCRYVLTLRHDQNDIPQYFSHPLYLSIPLKSRSMPLSVGDTLLLRVNTFSGMKELILPF